MEYDQIAARDNLFDLGPSFWIFFKKWNEEINECLATCCYIGIVLNIEWR
jgi:hypothetical protein